MFDPLLAQARVADPAGARAWGLRAFLRSGRRCVVLGRLEDGRIGRRADGRFEELSAGAPPSCLARGETTMVLVRTYGATTGRRAIVYGIAGRADRIAVGMRRPGREVPVADDGTFIYVAVGDRSLASANAYIIGRGGQVRVRPLGVR